MSKICIIGASNIKHISLISLYTNYFDKNGIEYDLIYWDRYNIEESCSAKNVYCYRNSDNTGKVNKILGFIKFRKFVVDILNNNKYKTVITWQTTVGYLLFDRLLFKHKNNYIINVRDYVAEKTLIGRALIKLLVKNAGMVTISSEGFKEFLPEAQYIKVNSINEDIVFDVGCYSKKQDALPYKIGFVGNCRYFNESYKLINALANDNRFEIWYCGTNSEVIEQYAKENNIKNVFVKPGFNKENTLKLFSEFDMINSAFGNDAMDNRTLVPIRLYTSLSLHIPMLCNAGTQLSVETEKFYLGYSIDTYEKLADDLYAYLSGLDKEKFYSACDEYLQNARKENLKFYEKVNEIINR